MSKILSATCENGIVKIEGKTVTATVLSQGKKASSGLGVIEKNQVTYLPSNASDIKDLIASLETIIGKIGDIATNLDAVTTTPGSASALITELATLKTNLGATKDNLK